MSTAMLPATPPANAKLSEWVQRDDVHAAIRAAVGDEMDCDKFISHALVSFQRGEVARCTPASKLKALYEMAALGLLETSRQCALIVREMTVRDAEGRTHKEPQVTVMPQWQGYKAVMERHPAVLEVQAYLVHVSDEFYFDGGELHHTFDPLDPERNFDNANDLRGGYAKVIYADGRSPRFWFVRVAQIEKCRRCAQTQNVWSRWYEQMALKTIYRDTYARQVVPIDPLVSARMEKIVAADDAVLGNSPYRVAASLPSGNERLRERLVPQARPEAEPEPPSQPEAAQDAPVESGGPAAMQDEPGNSGPTEADRAQLASIQASLDDASGIRICQNIRDSVVNAEGASDWLKTAVASAAEYRMAAIRASRGPQKSASEALPGMEDAHSEPH